MKSLVVFALLLVSVATASAQVASHAPTAAARPASSLPASSVFQISDKPVARVNGAVLTDRDLLREMLQIFPYASQHNGFPKEQEASIRQGALQMIIFEELVYQDALRRKLTVSPQELRQAEFEFKKQFHSADEYNQYLAKEMGGSEQKVRDKIKRSLLIEQVLKADVENKSAVSPADVRAYYEKNSAKFMVPESFSFQLISILPPRNATPEQQKEGQRRANEAWVQAKATKSYQEFGLLAEKVSEDDYRVNMGDHRSVERDKLPPQVVKAMLAMKPGDVSGVIQVEQAYTIIRLNAHTAAKRRSFEEVKAELRSDMQKNKYESLRVALGKRLSQSAKIEVL